MYKCERCGGSFAQFKTPGQCPLCGVWASVQCVACGFTAHANEFIRHSDQCPKCGARVAVPGRSADSSTGTGGWLLLIIVAGAILYGLYSVIAR